MMGLLNNDRFGHNRGSSRSSYTTLGRTLILYVEFTRVVLVITDAPLEARTTVDAP
jgi:hypothetical protein